MKTCCALLLLCALQLQAAEIKNVLFIVADDLKASVLGCYGDEIVRTPNIDRLANEGLTFQKAYCQGAWCAPSRQSFMTSRYFKDKNAIGMGEYFRKHGVYSARVGKIYHMRVPSDIVDGTPGPDHADCWDSTYNTQGMEAHTPGLYRQLNTKTVTTEMEGRQSTGTKHRMFVSVEAEGDGSDQPDYKAADESIRLLRKFKEQDQPFFLALGLVRPHYPSIAPKRYFDNYPLESIRLPKLLKGDFDDIPVEGRSGNHGAQNGISTLPENQKRMWQAYYATVEFIDDQIGRVLNELDTLGLRENTVIVFTSDHGYHLGEKELWEKFNLHEEVSRVPLIIAAPGYESGNTDAIAELVDIYPTIGELAGLTSEPRVEGLSLVSVLNDKEASVRDAAYTYYAEGNALRTQDWAYIRYGSGEEELYNMPKDPYQFHNLALNPEHAPRLKQFRAMLDQKLEGLRRSE